MAAHIIPFPATSARLATPRPTIVATLAAMWHARQTRRTLAGMDAHLLADIGIGYGDAMAEAARPFWDLSPRCR